MRTTTHHDTPNATAYPAMAVPDAATVPHAAAVHTAAADHAASARCTAARRGAATLLALAIALAGCGGSEPSTVAAPPVDEPSAAPADADTSDDEPETEEVDDEPGPPNVAPAETDDAPALVARVTDHLDELDVHDAPGSDAVTRTVAATTDFDSPTVLLVHEVDGDWLHVLLPGRPNGVTGWIHADHVEVSEVELHVKVDLDARELTVLEAGEEVLTTTVAIGDADHPTPTGTFSITDKLDTGDPSGAYGPFALGLSARSDVLTEFAGGDGQVGIHGTNVPSSLGEAASHGCIRVDNDVIEQLAHLLPLGTPVTVS